MVLEVLADGIRPIIDNLQVLVGGLFGAYIMLILVRVYYERKKVHILYEILYDLDRLNEHFKAPSARQRKNLWQRFISRIRVHLFKKSLPTGEDVDYKKRKKYK